MVVPWGEHQELPEDDNSNPWASSHSVGNTLVSITHWATTDPGTYVLPLGTLSRRCLCLRFLHAHLLPNTEQKHLSFASAVGRGESWFPSASAPAPPLLSHPDLLPHLHPWCSFLDAHPRQAHGTQEMPPKGTDSVMFFPKIWKNKKIRCDESPTLSDGQEMNDAPRRRSVSKSRVGFRTDLLFWFFLSLFFFFPSFSWTARDTRTGTSFQDVKIFLQLPCEQRNLFLKFWSGAVPHWMVKFHGLFSTYEDPLSL